MPSEEEQKYWEDQKKRKETYITFITDKIQQAC
jgi:hypothetical protein